MTSTPHARPSSDVAFTETVKTWQTRRGSRDHYAKKEAQGGFRTGITEDLAQFVAGITTAYLATANAAGQPYVQHRGGPPGFLRVVDEQHLGFVDFTGNRQYITTGNLEENPRVHLFLMDYENARRVKVWGTARIVEGDAALVARLFPEGYQARALQVVLIKVDAWDINCSQHIPKMFHAGEVAEAVGQLQARVRELEVETAALKARLGDGAAA